jgi:16S rRNA C967 or C1407 C5-methylase (RsmB/RsmF family)
MEAYYSLVGLHNTRYDTSTKQFVPCTNDEEKHAERDLFMSTLSAILPASFRVDRSLDSTIQGNILEELNEFVGKEMELEIELPQRSAAFGGMKHILEKGGTVATEESYEKKTKVEENPKSDDDAKEPANAGADAGAKEATDGDDNAKEDAAKMNGDSNNSNNKNDYQPIFIKKTVAPAKPIPFITSSDTKTTLGYQLSVDRRTLKRNKSLEPLHNWMKIQSDCGHITRQETVSMIPPVVLNAQEGMSVLDMCAAPGSKTCQLLEVVGGLDNTSGDKKEPSGYVVANDADEKRAYMLVNQLRRMNSPAVFTTSCDGQYFPILDDKSDRGTEKEGMFDRVLADVPCSGDGTVRKNPGIWRHWNQLGSLALHPLQLSIALRGARLTKVGGYMVYSTCSMNPMENESVVAELLRIGEGALVLEDPRERMEGLVARPGWSTWRVLRESKNRTRKAMKDYKRKNNPKMQAKRKEWAEKRAKGECPPPLEKQQKTNDQGQEVEEEEEEEKCPPPSPYDTIPYVPPATWDEAALSERTTSLGFVEYTSYEEVEEEWKRRVRVSCFPPTKEEADKFELHKSLRCLPQDMDTGGFYVALLKKVKPLGKNATDRMHALARESRGGGDVDTHIACNQKKKDGDEDDKKKSYYGKQDASEDVTMTESSAAEDTGADTTDVEPVADVGKVEDENKSKEVGKNEEEKEEPIQKAPQGKVGTWNHKHKNKKTDLGSEDFIPTDPSVWAPIIEEYGLAPTFPKEQFMVRASGEAKILYFITKSIKEELIDRGIQDRVTVINSGLKAFERCSLKEKRVDYRLAQEGIQFVVPHVTKRILSANMDDFFACVKEGFINFDKFSEPFQKELEKLEVGSFIVTLEGYEKDVAKKMYLSMWRRPSKTVNCFVTKVEMEAILSKMRALGYVAKQEDEEKNAVDDSSKKEDAKEVEGASSSKEKVDAEEKMDTSS